MRKIKLFLSLLILATFGISNAWGAETLYKNALFKIANCTKNSSYTGKVTCTIGDDIWVAQNAANNNGGWDYVKIGAKKSKSSDPTKVTTGTITTNAAYAEAVSKIVVNGKKDRGSFTSKLIIASNSSFTTDKVEITGATSFTNNQIVFEIASPSADKYYKLEFVCSNTTTSNGVIQVSSVEYYYEPSSEETVVSVPTFSVPEGTFYSPINVELSCSTADAEIHYTLDGSTPSSTSEKYTTAIAISETTTVKAIAVKDGLTDSEVATATYTKGETVTSYDIDFETNALEAYVNWDFSNITIAKIITAKGGTYYGNTSGKASASIKTKEKIQYPGILTFSVSKESTNTTASNWLVQVSDNGTTWTTVGTISATEMTKGSWKDHSIDLSDYENVYVQISYGSSTAIRAIDEISLAQGVAPVKYTLTIESPENGTLSVKKGGEAVASGDQFKAGTSLVVTPTPEAGYVFESLTVDGSAVELTEGSYTFNMPAANVTIAATFKENEKPAATLTLSKNGETEDITGYKQDDKVILPSITSGCVKQFVGWSADVNCAIEPEYKAGDEYTLESTTQTLYAVYADEKESTTTEEYTFTSFSSAQEVTLGSTSFRVKLQKGTGSTNPAWNPGSAEARIYAKGLLTIVASKPIVKVVYSYTINANNSGKKPTVDGVAGKNSAGTWDAATTTWNGSDTEIILSTSGDAGNVGFKKIVVTLGSIGYENYSTTCAAAPIATIDPTSVTATAAGANDKVEVTYENVNTANVAVALYNDAACTEAFTADWLTASLDGDKNIAYTVAATTLYTERKAYIQLTAPETTGATESAVVVIPVTQAGKDKVFASLEELVAAITPTMAGIEVTVTLTNEVIQDFYKSGSYTNGIALNVPYEGGVKVIEIYCKNVPAEWVKGGKVSGTITCPWKLYNSTWELCPTAWTELTYTAPATVSSIAVSGTPTKTTYIDGEKFDPAGLVVTATYSDASTGAIDAALVDWTFDPATLVKGQTSVNVTAKFNSVSSAAYEVTGLTVNDIPTKTVAEFIAAGGTRCYLEGIVSNITNTTYGNFDLTDASGTIYVYGCLNAAGESKKFAELGVKNGDKIKVIADEYELYNGTTEEAKNVQYVSHVSAASITIADITMEVGETKTIAATVVPAEAEVTYTIKENAANAISLSGNTITANAVGTATITATIAEGATYMGNSVDFTVTVGPKSEKTNVVILAEYKDKWYALVAAKGSANNTLGAVEVTYVNGVILDFDGDKASITWERAIVGNKATFKNGTNYVKGATGDTNLTLETSAFEWEVVDGKYLVESKRTFLYNKAGYFKNYDANTNAGKADYSAWPVVTAVEFMNSVTTPSVEKGIFSVADGKFVQFSTGNLQYEVGTNKWSFAENQYDYVGEENINVGNPSYTGKIDMFGWSADGKFGVNPSNKNEDYYGTFQDWGTLVNEADWYTLSADEWKYLLNTRANAANLKQIAKVGSVVGIMLFPDAWTMPADVNVAAAYDDYFKVNIYNYTLEQWAKLEAAGAVFLPAAGRRTGGWGNTTISPHMEGVIGLDSDGHYKHYDNGNIYCYYWTSTINESKDVSYLHNIQALGDDKYTIGTGAVWGEKGRYGQSVRLVKAIKPNYKREVRQGYYGTICLPNGGQMIGASLFGLSYYNEAQGLLYMDEVGTTTMTAGNPYIFLPNEYATKDTLYVFYDETTVLDADTVNGLVGYLGDENMQLPGDGTNYILQDNKIKKVVGGNNSNVFVTKNRAYIQLGKVKKNEPAPVPGRRRVAIGQAPQVATGMESVDASAQPVKMIIDGQLYILRGEKMYDAQGKLVK